MINLASCFIAYFSYLVYSNRILTSVTANKLLLHWILPYANRNERKIDVFPQSLHDVWSWSRAIEWNAMSIVMFCTGVVFFKVICTLLRTQLTRNCFPHIYAGHVTLTTIFCRIILTYFFATFCGKKRLIFSIFNLNQRQKLNTKQNRTTN